jgi:hypothetical protein
VQIQNGGKPSAIRHPWVCLCVHQKQTLLSVSNGSCVTSFGLPSVNPLKVGDAVRMQHCLTQLHRLAFPPLTHCTDTNNTAAKEFFTNTEAQSRGIGSSRSQTKWHFWKMSRNAEIQPRVGRLATRSAGLQMRRQAGREEKVKKSVNSSSSGVFELISHGSLTRSQ